MKRILLFVLAISMLIITSSCSSDSNDGDSINESIEQSENSSLDNNSSELENSEALNSSDEPYTGDENLLYYEDFESYYSGTSHEHVLKLLGWSADAPNNNAYSVNTTKYSFSEYEGKKMLCLTNTEDKSTDSYAVILSEEQMGIYHEQNYTYQYDVVYVEGSNTNRFISVVSDYSGLRYNSFILRIRGTGNNQTHYDNKWVTYDGGLAAKTDENSIVSRLLGLEYDANAYSFYGISVSVRYVVNWEKGNSVYLRVNNDGFPGSGKWTLISQYSADSKASDYLDPKKFGGAIVLKTGGKIQGYVDNIIVWKGNGEEPENKSDWILKPKEEGCSGHTYGDGTDCSSACLYCGVYREGTGSHSYVPMNGVDDKSCSVCGALESNEGSGWLLENIPKYETKGKYSKALYFSGFGIEQKDFINDYGSFTASVISTSEEEYIAYTEKLSKYYKKVYENQIGENLFSQFECDGFFIYTYFVSYANQARIIYDVSTDFSNDDFGYTYEKKDNDTTVIYQYGIPMCDFNGDIRTRNNGMMYAIKLADNSVILIDSGASDQFDDAQCDGLLDFLYEVTGTSETEKIRIAAWYFTHRHGDHTEGSVVFLKKYHDKVNVERLCYNFPTMNGMDVYSREGAADEKDVVSTFTKYYPDIMYSKVHMGQSISFADVKFTFLLTHTELMLGQSGNDDFAWDFNNSSSIVMVEFDGKKFLITGDTGTKSAEILVKLYDEEILKTDIIQASHHLYNNLPGLYEAAKASIVFIPQSRYKISISGYMKPIYDMATKYAEKGMIYYISEGTIGIACVDDKLRVVFKDDVKGIPRF